MLTYQDYLKVSEYNKMDFLRSLVREHMETEIYQIAKSADNYDAQRNETICNYVQMIFTLTGDRVKDFTASNNRISSNFFHRLNTQRNTYLLGNGVSFTEHKKETINEEGLKVTIDETKEMLGQEFDTDLKDAGYYALIHGVTFGFWNLDRLHVFPVTEFAPLWDEETGQLRAGLRFWQLESDKPVYAVFYEEDGYTKLHSVNDEKSKSGSSFTFEISEPKHPYKLKVQVSEADGEEVIGEDNYGVLPIIPLYGSNLKQSTLVGMKEKIDSYDLIRSGFANDLTDVSQVYWILENATGMSDNELARFRDRLKLNHIAAIDAENSKAVPYTQDIPYQARSEYLDQIRAGIYEDFGGLDVHTIAAGATNDHIDAAYQPMDEEADAYEYQIIKFIQHILMLNGIEDTPVFKRNRISNQKEQTDMVLSVADWLDDETILSKLPFISVDEIANILAKKDKEMDDRLINETEEFVEEDIDEEYQEEDDEMEGAFAELEALLGE